jgi:hypothetical protein
VLDVSARKVFLASPELPSGASWLINCLLELGVRVDHKPAVDRVWRGSNPIPAPDHMWLVSRDRLVLNPKVEVLKKWLPILSRREEFSFRDDLEVEYVQDFPAARMHGQECLFFVRDPRDAVHSQYRRARSELEFDAYARFLHPETLLDQASHWALFARSWVEFAAGRVYRFEDYKRDARALLRQIVEALGLEVAAASLDRAVEESSFEKSREAELRFKAEHPNDTEVANRAGKAGEWQSRGDIGATTAFIEARTADMLARLDYPVSTGAGCADREAAPAHLDYLAYFSRIELLWSVREAVICPLRKVSAIGVVAEFVVMLDETVLMRSRLAPAEVRTLLASIDEAGAAHAREQKARLDKLAARYADGSPHHMQRIRELMGQRRASRSPVRP